MFCVVFIVLDRVIYVRPSEAKEKSIKKMYNEPTIWFRLLYTAFTNRRHSQYYTIFVQNISKKNTYNAMVCFIESLIP